MVGQFAVFDQTAWNQPALGQPALDEPEVDLLALDKIALDQLLEQIASNQSGMDQFGLDQLATSGPAMDPMGIYRIQPVPYVTADNFHDWQKNIQQRCTDNGIELRRLDGSSPEFTFFGVLDTPAQAVARSRHVDGLLRNLIGDSIDAETKKKIFPLGNDVSFFQPIDPVVPTTTPLTYEPFAPILWNCVESYFQNLLKATQDDKERRLASLHAEAIAGLEKLRKQRKHNKPECIAQWAIDLVEEHRRRALPLMGQPFYQDEAKFSAQLFCYFQERAPRLYSQYILGGLVDRMPYQLAYNTCLSYWRQEAAAAARQIEDRESQVAAAEARAEAMKQAKAKAKARARTAAMVQNAVSEGLASYINIVSPPPSFASPSPATFVSPFSSVSPGLVSAGAISGSSNDGPSQLKRRKLSTRE